MGNPSRPTAPHADQSGQMRKVTIISPHFDDAPLALGQSMTNGLLAGSEVTVIVVFGRTSYTAWPVPRPLRTPLVMLWRRVEETAASRAFGYRWDAERLDDSSLRARDRAGTTEPTSQEGRSRDALIRGQVQSVIAAACSTSPLVLAPAGLGGNADHLMAAQAAAQLVKQGIDNIAFYGDRPYLAGLSEAAIEDQISQLGLQLRSLAVSGPFTAASRRRLRLCYPSQRNAWFIEMLEASTLTEICDRIWVPRAADMPDLGGPRTSACGTRSP